MTSVARVRHLVRRFTQTVRGRTPSPADVEWARSLLTPAEATLFDKMSETDQAHAIEVACLASERVSGDQPDGAWVLSAALLHDIGKIESGAGVAGRVVATVLDPIVGAGASRRLAGAPGWFGSVGRHLTYPERGASLLGAIGSDPLVRAWAAEHHRSESGWTVPVEFGRILRDADDAAS